jgi:predicted transcriptional regulator
MKKYNKLDKQQVLSLFQEKAVVNRADITKKYGCSVYSTRQIVDDLLDEKIIRITNYGYKLKTN